MKANKNNNFSSSPFRKYVAGGVALAAVVSVGCAMAQENGTASSSALAPQGQATTAPAVQQTPAIQSAAAMQTAFAQVARVAEPAVVTISTERRLQRAQADGPGGGFRRFGPSPFGSGDPFEEFFRGFPGPGVMPNSYEGGGGRPLGDTRQNGFRFTQATPPAPGGSGGGGSSSTRGPLVRTGEGSGFIYQADGLIMTNAHVVADADVVTVRLLDGREFRNAKVLGSDERTDIAVVKIPATGLPTVKLGNSTAVNVGDWAIAVGNPFGLENTLTVGVVSAKAREVDLSPNSANDYLQTDASINPGNSGGPLLDIYGRVIGVNNAIYSRSGGNVGIGFAIPIDTAKSIAQQLVENGRVRRAQLGVRIGDVGQGQASAFGLPAGTQGAIVGGVEPGSAAAKAGLQLGDVITAFNGQKITNGRDLIRNVTSAPIGQQATVTVLRGGKTLTVNVTPTEVPEESGTGGRRPGGNREEAPVAPETPNQGQTIGVGLAPLTPELARQFRLPQGATGVLVARVQPDGPAARAGVRPGDLISRVGQTQVSTPEEAGNAVRQLLSGQKADERGNKSVALYITRGQDSQFLVVTVPQE